MNREENNGKRFRSCKAQAKIEKVFIIICVILMIIRCFFGIELTDEAYYIAEARLVAHGAVPFVNNWTQVPGYTIFYAWLVWLYEYFLPSLTGIFLFTRLTFLVFRLLILALCYKIVKPYISEKVAFVGFMLLIPFGTDIPNFSYNTLAIYFMLLAGCLVVKALLEEKASIKKKYLFLGGILVAFVVYAHPAEIFNVVTIGFIIILCSNKGKKTWSLFYYVLGGMLAAIIVSAYMIIAGGGIEKFLYGMDSYINYNPYFELGRRQSFKETLVELMQLYKLDFLICFVVCGIVYAKEMLKCFLVKEHILLREVGKKSLYIWLLVEAVYIIAATPEKRFMLGKLSGIIAVVTIAFWALEKKEKLNMVVAGLFAIVPIVYFIFNTFATYSWPAGRLYELFPVMVVMYLDIYTPKNQLVSWIPK